MSYAVETIPYFDRRLKQLRKKYASIVNDVNKLTAQLQQAPELGTPLGRGCYKIRLAVTSKGQGKSGGARVVTYVRIVGEKVFLLAIYDKSEQASISNKEIELLLDGLQA